MDIVIVAQYLLDITKTENLNSRFVYLANMLKDENDVEIVTTDFIHTRKENVTPISNYHNIKITMLHEPGYKKNVSIKRFRSHAKLAKNINKYLSERKKPDLIYCAIPSTDVAAVVAGYCEKNNVKFIVDIQDLWPEAFKMVFNIPVISDVVFYPIAKKAEKVYKTADAIVSVSNTYINKAKKYNNKAKTLAVFLGTDKEQFDKNTHKNVDNDVLKIAYIGSLEKSYDLETAIKAVAMCKNVQLVVIGDGSRRTELECIAKENNANCIFLGYLSYCEMIQKMTECDVAINPISKGSAGSVINKVGDYAMAGLPVINTQESAEYRGLLEKYECGINCECENIEEVVNAIRKLTNDENLRIKMSLRSRQMGEELFDRSSTYLKIKEIISVCKRNEQ